MKNQQSIFRLDTNKTNSDIIKTSINVLVHQERPTLVEGEIFQHLYIISDDEIKIGDWFINLSNLGDSKHNLIQCTTDACRMNANDSKYWKKIIASTDDSLGVPLINGDFISLYCEMINAGKNITFVNVEFNIKQFVHASPLLGERIIEELSLFIKDNHVQVSLVEKEIFDREEVLELLKDCWNASTKQQDNNPDFDTWVKLNVD